MIYLFDRKIAEYWVVIWLRFEHSIFFRPLLAWFNVNVIQRIGIEECLGQTHEIKFARILL